MSQTNFLIGRGELLTYDIKGPKRHGDKAEVYTLHQAVERLAPQFTATANVLDNLPDLACPGDYGVARLALNPGYIARSYFPAAMLRSVGLESVGSRAIKLTPEAWTKKGIPLESSTTEIFVVGKRQAFRQLKYWAEQQVDDSNEAKDLAHIERFSAFEPEDRIASMGTSNDRFFEVGLHLLPNDIDQFVQRAFTKYAAAVGVTIHADLAFSAGNLWFLPVEGGNENVRQLAEFSFVRVIRTMPKLRGTRPVQRSTGVAVTCNLPMEQPLSSEPKVAILDGGLPKSHCIEPWLNNYRLLDENAEDDPDAIEHGLGVTSAFLFGPIAPNSTAARPYAYVDHLRVLDRDTGSEDPLELYRTLGLVEEVLLSRQYQFINLSLGPDLPIDDADVHAWTSVIDDLLSDGDTLMTVAVGNNGEMDRSIGNARVQVPSDCVNALSVGATDSIDTTWARAAYSAVGPGRSPGVVKPDLMAFGGDANSSKYFHVLAEGEKPTLAPQLGTSFAAPYLLRNAVGVRAILGADLTPLAIKALLVHGADPGHHDMLEVGWGKVPEDLMQIITCPAGVARVVYQGELKPGKYLRAALPLPAGGLQGNIRLKATFCYATSTDPQDATSYTRAGLEVVFRPSDKKVKEGKANPETATFFSMKKYATEEERRSDLGKWETVLHGNKSMRGRSLDNPVFDIHYNAREGGGLTTGADKIRYALIISVEAPKHADLYNEILRSYAKTLVPLQPKVTLPIRT
ncbi:S8 family peptidase [Laribacter hongkongensis]|uniref:S8 family peptidase n=1 Tax=Laribacter hongkongensis TaxID=168471 RepID=UPI001EFC9FAB|nr:S8 family peptidase [Laribacter hongkongensis]MCG8995046.1 S8 family peptidase [Laribacter hongkongensis]MCG9011157.1 S8 family peptidase [Laribacter hongkongensis]MCG9023556.1 S8 family peptidase [Laribacter hongkongensis]MCG9047213.1 S8 family peptidase [Laribacter hongkongensis]MCG9074589.1 S8 family peptidase [Laribacter hongkongensis]